MALVVACAATLACVAPARGDWRPAGIAGTAASLESVLAANARATGRDDDAVRRRRERWIYAAGGTRVDVDVAVRDDDYRTTSELDGRSYAAGRLAGVRWRADANGNAHDVATVEYGDALDRSPQSFFALDAASCSLVGEARIPNPAWVVRTARHDEPPAFLYVDEASGSVVRETWREAPRTVTVRLDTFRPFGGGSRARHWTVDDGDPAHHIDATLDRIAAGDVAAADVRRPDRQTFAPSSGPVTTTDLPASFSDGYVSVPVDVAGVRARFALDTVDPGTIVTPAFAKRFVGSTMQHATLPSLAVGALALANASAIIGLPFHGIDGLLGSSFFAGHVVEIDFLNRRVRVLSAADAELAFADPRVAVVAADVSHGILLAPATIGTAPGRAFAIDVTSNDVLVSSAFAARHETEIGSWPRRKPPFDTSFAGYSARFETHDARVFSFANAVARDQPVVVQLSSVRDDDVPAPFDGSIGNAILRNFDLFVDYDGGRIGLRP